MPRNVRNFWIELEVDGRKTPIASGPTSKTGGFNLVIHQRYNGSVLESVLTVIGDAVIEPDGNISLTLDVRGAGVKSLTRFGKHQFKCKTIR